MHSIEESLLQYNEDKNFPYSEKNSYEFRRFRLLIYYYYGYSF